jgi:hypothetical protein
MVQAALAFSLAALLQDTAGAQTVTQALQAERAGRTQEARELLARAASEGASNSEAQLAYAEFLDRYGDTGALAAYQAALRAAPSNEIKQRIAKRLAVLALEADDRTVAESAAAAYGQAGGAGWEQAASRIQAGADLETSDFGTAEIPGILDGFLRMAALSTDLEPEQLLPALAKNLVTRGYRVTLDALNETEYLKLVKQYLSQARELRQFAGDDNTLDVPACESAETAQLLKTLGYRLRSECGPEAVLETVNPSRAFLSIDSAFPLSELEDAYRRDAAFHLPYGVTKIPVLFGPEYWMTAATPGTEGEFIDVFLSDPALARLYSALAKMNRPTAIALRQAVPIATLKNYAPVLDFFGESFEIRDGRAITPGGARARSKWEDLTGVSPDKGPAFFEALIQQDDGWMAAYFDAMTRVSGAAETYLGEPRRMERFYGALRGRVTSPGPARPIFRATGDLLLLATRLAFDANGQVHVPGTVEAWKNLFETHPHGKYDGKLTRSSKTWSEPDDVIEALFGLSRKVVENQPLEIFLAITNLERARSQPFTNATVERLMLDYPKYGAQFSYLSESPSLSDQTVIAFLDSMSEIETINNYGRRSDIVGSQQALVSLWQILVREGHISPQEADKALYDISTGFKDVRRNDDALFQATRTGVQRLLAAANVPAGADPHVALVRLLAGRPGPGETSQHEAIVERFNSLFTQQRLVSIKTLFDLADHLERVSRGESFNVAMANRLAETISDVRLPQSELSTAEANAIGVDNWVDRHIRDQRDLNLQRLVDRAAGDLGQMLEIRGTIAPILRDSLVGLVYVYYSPPGAELIRANPLFVRSHDFAGSEGRLSWTVPRDRGIGWPASAGGRLIGSLAGLPYTLNDAEQNFLVPTERQALIWQDLAPQVLLGATVPRWWDVSRSELHYVGLHLRMGQALVAESKLDPQLAVKVFDALRQRVSPSRLWLVESRLAAGNTASAIEVLTPAEYFDLAASFASGDSAYGDPFVSEIRRLRAETPERFSEQRISSTFGIPHPALSESYRPELLRLPLFPTMMGYSSRALAESWESTNLYWAALADEAHLEPADLNLRIPEWTQQSIERIFATHLEDWPALLRSIRIVGDRYRGQAKQAAAAGVGSSELVGQARGGVAP